MARKTSIDRLTATMTAVAREFVVEKQLTASTAVKRIGRKAARHDLKLSGVIDAKADSCNDPLVVEAVLTYCKARFGLDNPDSEKYWASYLACERDMLNSQEYTVEVGEE